MGFVKVEQLNARLAAAVRIESVKGREGDVTKGTVTIISNARRGSGDGKSEEATAIQWTLWGRQAENAAKYLSKGSRVNVVGRVQNNTYEKDGATVYGLQFTCEELDYLDSRAESEARRSRKAWTDDYDASANRATPARGTTDRGHSRSRHGAAAN